MSIHSQAQENQESMLFRVHHSTTHVLAEAVLQNRHAVAAVL